MPPVFHLRVDFRLRLCYNACIRSNLRHGEMRMRVATKNDG